MNMRMIRSTRRFGLQTALIASIAALWGCLGGQGSTDGGSGADNNSRGSVFVADETTTGSIEVEVEEAASSFECRTRARKVSAI
jgi:hypothetical protein